MKYILLLATLLITLGHHSFGQHNTEISDPIIVIHGGAGFIEKSMLTDEEEKEVYAAIESALEAGHKVLTDGGSAELAVVAAIKILENSPHFNAGKGAVMTAEGRHELDASIMRGSDLQAGAVAGVTTLKNPIEGALAVMNESWHVMLQGEGADAFARSQKLEQVDNSYFTTPKVKAEWAASKAEGYHSPISATLRKFGTVGCVARDKNGNLAAGTSTGGLMNKEFGRVGDSPIIGAGTYADNKTCAVSCTGQGEYYIRLGFAKEISDHIAFGKVSLEKAVKYTLFERLDPMEALGGVIALDVDGNISMEFNTPGMYRGWKTLKETEIKLYGKED